ncbi:DUF763 domain-containing protein [bacterium]|nr:DUF763 domain-containing protein [bacterium]
MRRRGIANLPLHGGRAPRWLFERMTKLSAAIAEAMVILFGREEFLRRLADPVWFQAFGCILGFDWHSSGLTTTVMGALKEGLRDRNWEIGIFVAGGKGKTSRKTPTEILQIGERTGMNPQPLVYASRMTAKVDSAAVQDGYQIYHHTIIFTADGKWTVVQQGMNDRTGFARRYHWISENLESFVDSPHTGIVSDSRGVALDMTAKSSAAAREASVVLTRENPDKIARELQRAQQILSGQPDLFSAAETDAKLIPEKIISFHRAHPILSADIDPRKVKTVLLKTYEKSPQNYEQLLGIPGVGPATVRALALLSELLYDAKPSFDDPARFSFAHGGKDGHPYPVNRIVYDKTIYLLEEAIRRAKIEPNTKDNLLFKLGGLFRLPG